MAKNGVIEMSLPHGFGVDPKKNDDLPCYIKKESRTEEEKEHRYPICKCGHYMHDHQQNAYKFGIWLWIITLGYYGGGCDDCKCGVFSKLGNFTYSEVGRLKPCEDSE